MLGYDKASNIVSWRENEPFYAKLKFESFERGRSAAHAIFRDSKSSARYPMFLTDISAAMEELRSGFLEGDFMFAKRGSNYGLKLIRSASLPEQIAHSI